MAQHGGYRRPTNPAPVSGPGRLSQRTDGQGPSQKLMPLTDQDYGDRTASLQLQRSAPMAQSPSITPAAVPDQQQLPQAPPYGGVPFGAGTQRPDEPVTQGAPSGPGAGPEVLNSTPVQQPTGYITSMLTQMSPQDTTGTLAQLLLMAKQRGV